MVTCLAVLQYRITYCLDFVFSQQCYDWWYFGHKTE